MDAEQIEGHMSDDSGFNYAEASDGGDPSDIILLDRSRELLCCRFQQHTDLHNSLRSYISATATAYGFITWFIPNLVGGGPRSNEHVRQIQEFARTNVINERIFDILQTIRIATFVVTTQNGNITISHASTTKINMDTPTVSLTPNNILIEYLIRKIYNDFTNFSTNGTYIVHIDFYFSRIGAVGSFHRDIAISLPNPQYASLEYFFDEGIVICGPEILESSTNFGNVSVNETVEGGDDRLMDSARLPIRDGDVILFNDLAVLHASPQPGDNGQGRARPDSDIIRASTRIRRTFIRCHIENPHQHHALSGRQIGPIPLSRYIPTREVVLDSATSVRRLRETPGHPFVGGGKVCALLFNETMFKECTNHEAIKFEENIKYLTIKAGGKSKKSKKSKRPKRKSYKLKLKKYKSGV